MRSLCLYFQIHQPYRLRTYRFFDIGKDHYYYDDYLNRSIIQRIAEKCYFPANAVLLDLIKEYGDSFRISFSFSGIALDQMEQYAPHVIDSFRKLVNTGKVEILTETDAHSLASLRSKEEFIAQVKNHSKRIERLFGQKPTTFRNTELIYSDSIGEMVAEMGYEMMLLEGAKHILGWKSPNFMYCNAINPRLKLLLRNFRLSDDIAFRFSLQSWSEWPLTADKFAGWLKAFDRKEEVVNVFMDYETFGEHQWKETGIFDFLKALPGAILKKTGYSFNTPSELAGKLQPVSAIHVPHAISWADEERDLTAWIGNELQDEAFDNLYAIEDKVKATEDPFILNDWRRLQSSDHFYYMCTKWFSDGDVHKYFNPYPSPYEAFINYMNVLSDFMIRVEKAYASTTRSIPPETPVGKKQKPGIKTKTAGKTVSQAKKKDYQFSDIGKLTKTQLKTLAKTCDMKIIAHALTGVDLKTREKFISNLTKTHQLKFEAMSINALKAKKTEINKFRAAVTDEINRLFN